MVRRIADEALDAALSYIRTNVTIQHAVSADPVNFAGIAAVSLASVAMADADITIGVGTVSGRKLTVAAKTAITPSANGTATHLVLADATNSILLLQVPIPATALVTSINTDFASWEHEFRDPVSG